MTARFSYDLSSPYAYLAAERARGVVGIPTLEVGGELYWGDDRLADAAAAAA